MIFVSNFRLHSTLRLFFALAKNSAHPAGNNKWTNSARAEGSDRNRRAAWARTSHQVDCSRGCHFPQHEYLLLVLLHVMVQLPECVASDRFWKRLLNSTCPVFAGNGTLKMGATLMQLAQYIRYWQVRLVVHAEYLQAVSLTCTRLSLIGTSYRSIGGQRKADQRAAEGDASISTQS